MDENPVKRMKYVNTGEVKSGGIETILNSGAIGSCIVVIASVPEKNVGAMAHVMLPGTTPVKNQLNDTRYAANAIEELISHLRKFGIINENIEICLVGGANVLKRENDTIGIDNITSVEKVLLEKQIDIKAKEVGGFKRRTALFDIESGYIYYTVGNSKPKILWHTRIK